MPYYGTNGFYLPFNDNSSANALGFDQSGDTTSRVNASVFGNTIISTAQSKFGGSSAYFDGNGDVLTVPDYPGFTMGAGDFTVEFWVRFNSVSTRQYLVYQGDNGGSNASISFFIELTAAGNFRVLVCSGTTFYEFTSTFSPTINTWHHVTMVRNGGTLTAYVDGTSIGSVSVTGITINDSSDPLKIGDYNTAASTLPLNGYIDDLRIYKGVAKYTANFTPSTTALPLGNSDPYWKYCVLAMPMDGANNSTVFPVYAANSWTPLNLSVTAGAGNDSMIDSPTDYDDGGNGRGNYATLDPLALGGGALSDGNLKNSISDFSPAVANMPMISDKWYWEVTLTTSSNPRIGVYDVGSTAPTNFGTTAYGWCLINNPSRIFNNNVVTNYGSFSGSNGNIVMLAYDANLGRLWYGEDGTWFASGDPANNANPSQTSVTGKAIVPASSSGSGSNVHDFNFGQRPFSYTPPTGFKALNTANLPEPVIKRSNTQFDVVTYTGNGGQQTIGGLNFTPDLVWIKSRSAATDHALYDTVRGATKDLASNTNDAETTQTTGLTAFNSDGFTIDSLAKINTNAATYVAWCWNAGETTTTNTAGSITSTVRANPSAGFSVVRFTAPASGAYTLGHGLGVTPSFVIIKETSSSGPAPIVYHVSINPGTNNYLVLSSTVATASAAGIWGTGFTSNFISSTAGTGVNQNATAIAYCFAPVAGFSSFDSYTGNGNANGPFVHLGFKPALVIIKMSSSTGDWVMLDDKREGYNVDNDPLWANLTTTEGTTDLIDFTANGFKVRSTDANVNTNAGTYIYMAWAESPFKNSLAE